MTSMLEIKAVAALSVCYALDEKVGKVKGAQKEQRAEFVEFIVDKAIDKILTWEKEALNEH